MSRKRKRAIPRPAQNRATAQEHQEPGQVFQLQILDGLGAADSPVTAKNRVRQLITVNAMAPAPTERAPDDVIAWTEPNTVNAWAKVFKMHRTTMTRYLLSQTIKNRKVGRFYMLAVASLSTNQQAPYRAAR